MYQFTEEDIRQMCTGGESAFNIIPQSDRDRMRLFYPGPELYQSRFACKVRQEHWCSKTGCYKTMGCPAVCLNHPQDFLKKYTGGFPCFWKYQPAFPAPPPRPRRSRRSRSNNKKAKPCCNPSAKMSQSEGLFGKHQPMMTTDAMMYSQPFQTPADSGNNFSIQNNGDHSYSGEDFIEEDDCCKYGGQLDPNCDCEEDQIPMYYNGPFKILDRGEKDFIRDNFLAVIRSQPKIPNKRIVDAHTGHISEFVPERAMGTRDFGRVPLYIKRLKNQLCQEDMEMKAELLNQAGCRILTDSERCIMLNELQLQWKEALDDFQRLPLRETLSPTSAKRKSEIEESLSNIESNILLCNRNGPLYVTTGNCPGESVTVFAA